MRYLDVDSRGRLLRLWNAGIVPSGGIFRCVIQSGDCWENAVLPEWQEFSIERESDRIVLRTDKLRTEEREFDIALTLVIREEGEEVRFTGSVENRDPEAMVTDFCYPSLGFLESLSGQKEPIDLLWPMQSGMIYRDIGAVLTRQTSREMEHQLALQYPGAYNYGGSMSWLLLRDSQYCLYLGSHDSEFHASTLRAFGDSEGKDRVGLELNRMSFVRSGETWTIPDAAAMLYKGDWKTGAKRYRKWADTWFDRRTAPEWVRKMNGYFLVINKQQFRKSCWPYSTLPELYRYARAYGLDTLGLFGWYETGHDNGYPDLVPAQDLGGEEGLIAGLKALHEAGGRATLYYQGNLIDTGSKFYREHGAEVEGRSRWGQPYIQSFDKALHSDFLRYFSGKWFSTACPGHPLWRRCMTEKAKTAKDYGADGVLYDQIGGMGAYPCFNPEHGHKRPSTSYAQGRRLLMGDIRRQAEENGPEFSFFSEHITDVYAQYLDCLHGMHTSPGRKGEEAEHFPEMFRYTFPECDLTVRNGNPYMRPRLVNYAVAYGMKFEMEIRYENDRKDLLEDAYPEFRAYSKKAGDLRRAHEDTLLLGTFLADEGIRNTNPDLVANVFRAPDSRKALVLWNDSPETIRIRLDMDYRPVRWEGLDSRGEGMPGELQADQLVVVDIE